VAQAQWALGMAVTGQGRHAEATALHKRALVTFSEIGDRYFTGMCFIGLAQCAVPARPRDAVRLLAAEELGDVLAGPGGQRHRIQQVLRPVRLQRGDWPHRCGQHHRLGRRQRFPEIDEEAAHDGGDLTAADVEDPPGPAMNLRINISLTSSGHPQSPFCIDDTISGGAGNNTLDGGAGNDAIIAGLGNDTAFGGAGDDLFLYTEPQLLGGSSTSDHFDGGTGFNTLALRLDPAAQAFEQADVAANFHPGQPFKFSGIDLTVTNIQLITFAAQANFSDVPLPGGDLGAQLQKADLFGLV
jgi:hypothetical protein